MREKILIGLLIWIFTKVVPGFLKKGWERFKNRQQNSENASHDYDTPYKKRHGRLQVSCIGMDASKSLDDIYVVVQLLGTRRSTKHTSPEAVEEAFRKSSRRFSTLTSDKRQEGMRVANNEQYLMVLGGPGAGKSTFLRKIGLEALKGEDGNLEHQCIPVFLELRRFTKDPIDIEAWIINEFKVCGYPYPEQWANAKLESGELLILFDGLDEVPKPNVKNVINKIRDFVHQYSQNRFIVSCREGAYKGGFTDFATVEMADFDDSQIQDYINNWFASASDRKKRTAQECWEALNASNHQAIKELAKNPLSLALLCQVYEDSQLCQVYEDSQDFPSNQAILYEKILNIFLKKWSAEKHVRRDPPMSPHLAIPTVKELLSEIAAENFKADRPVFSENELIDQIQEFYQRRTDTSLGFDASDILDAILVDPGLFVERANGIYTFFHLTFQEYLTANHFIKTQSIQNLVSNHLRDDRYREIFLFTAGLMGKADNLLLVMEAEVIEDIETPEIEELFRWAEKIIDGTHDRYDRIAKQLFAIRQFFSLWMLNQIYEKVDDIYYDTPDYDDPDYDDSEPDWSSDQDFEFYLLLDPGKDLYQGLEQHLYQDLDLNFLSTQNYRGLNRYRDLYLDLCWKSEIARDPCTNLHQDIYRYMDSNSDPLRFSKFGDQFSKELDNRIAVVERMEQIKIFNGVDLQRMVQRFKTQREFIKTADEGEPVKSPKESIHETWLAVLGITKDMLRIPPEELNAYVLYIEAVELIFACEAAGCVSPEVWQEIEGDFLKTLDARRISEAFIYKKLRDYGLD